MQTIRKTYTEISPDLLYSVIRDFALNQGLTMTENRQETYTLPDRSADFITRGTLAFSTNEGGKGQECFRVQIVGTAREDTKLLIDVDESLVPEEMLTKLQADVDFIFASHEAE